jgi:hypothetical protein
VLARSPKFAAAAEPTVTAPAAAAAPTTPVAMLDAVLGRSPKFSSLPPAHFESSFAMTQPPSSRRGV